MDQIVDLVHDAVCYLERLQYLGAIDRNTAIFLATKPEEATLLGLSDGQVTLFRFSD